MSGLVSLCSSCLGLNRRRKPRDTDDTDALLNDQQLDYGAIIEHAQDEVDEEELERERQALELITNEAADRMISVSRSHGHDDYRPISSQLSHDRQAADMKDAEVTTQKDDDEEEEEDEEDAEAAWLASCAGTTTEDITKVRGLEARTITIDMNHLRSDDT